MKHRIQSLFLGAFWALIVPNLAFTQTDIALLGDLAKENKASVEALVLYPSETRMAILEATKYPEVLIKMQDMRTKTSAAFRTLIEDFPRSTQEVFYDLNRYPGLTESVVAHKNEPSALRQDLELLPEGKRDATYGVVTRQMPTLIQIANLNQTTLRAFERLISGYSVPAQQAFRQLLGLPEVIDLLNEDLRFTILVGETYRDNPAWVIYKTDSLNLAVARAHAEELDNWRNSIENDPVAKAELQSAASEYAAENGYDPDDYYSDDLYNDGDYHTYDNDIQVHHYYEPYPYWYGYPWWEPYPRWRPYPWWYDWGCHFYPHGPVIIIYLPSYHFTHWYFDNPHHHNHYNHLSGHFVNHYYGHRHSGTTISTGVREWREHNRTMISDEFLADKNRLPERMKEYGRFEEGRKAFNAKNPQKEVTPEAYLEKNARKYPELERSREAAKMDVKREEADIRAKRATWAPAKAPATPEPTPAPKAERPPRVAPAPGQKVPPSGRPNKNEPVPAPNTERPPRINPNPDTKEPKTDKPVTREPSQRPQTRPDAGKDYNQQKWEERKPAQQTTRPNNPAPATPRTPKTAPQTQKKRGG